MRVQAIAIWLDAEFDVRVDRVSRREGRPLLAGKDPRTVLTELAEKRNPIYALAPIHIQSMAATHEATVDKIMKALEEWQIGRETCRERVCQYVWISVVAGALNRKSENCK